jgi:phage tail sheath gpL-like
MVAMNNPVPSTLDTPGSYQFFSNQRSGGALATIAQRVLLVGVLASAGTATAETPVQILDVNDAITKFGQGSEMHLMAAKAFEQGILNAQVNRGASMPELWGCPIAAPGASVAAAETLTVTVTTAVAGNVIIRIAGRTLSVGVAAGDAQNTIATAIKNAINANARDLPVTAGVAANVVTATHVTTGTNGNDVVYEVVSTPSGVSVALAQSVAGTGTVDITNALNAAVDKNYDAIAVSIHSGTAVTDALAHLADMWLYSQKFWRWIFIGDKATLGTAQGYATSGNSEKLLVTSCERCPNLPSEIATAAAVCAFGTEAPNANLDDAQLALYPPPTSYVYTAAEQESAIDGGVTPLAPTANGQRLRVVRMVTTKTKNDAGDDFPWLLDLAYSRTPAYRATQYDRAFRDRFKQEILDGALDDPEATLLKRIRDTCIGVDRAMAKNGWLRDVEDLIGQFLVGEADNPQGRVLVRAPCKVAGPHHQTVVEHLNLL